MGVSATVGDRFTGVGTPILGVDGNGIVAPFPVAQASETPPASTDELHVPSAHTAAIITWAAVAGVRHGFKDLVWSYVGSGTLAGGRLTVADGSDTIFDIDISAQGPGFIPITKEGHAGRAMVITLADGGANVQGKLDVGRHFQVSALSGWELDFSNEENSGLLTLLF